MALVRLKKIIQKCESRIYLMTGSCKSKTTQLEHNPTTIGVTGEDVLTHMRFYFNIHNIL